MGVACARQFLLPCLSTRCAVHRRRHTYLVHTQTRTLFEKNVREARIQDSTRVSFPDDFLHKDGYYWVPIPSCRISYPIKSRPRRIFSTPDRYLQLPAGDGHTVQIEDITQTIESVRPLLQHRPELSSITFFAPHHKKISSLCSITVVCVGHCPLRLCKPALSQVTLLSLVLPNKQEEYQQQES